MDLLPKDYLDARCRVENALSGKRRRVANPIMSSTMLTDQGSQKVEMPNECEALLHVRRIS